MEGMRSGRCAVLCLYVACLAVVKAEGEQKVETETVPRLPSSFFVTFTALQDPSPLEFFANDCFDCISLGFVLARELNLTGRDVAATVAAMRAQAPLTRRFQETIYGYVITEEQLAVLKDAFGPQLAGIVAALRPISDELAAVIRGST